MSADDPESSTGPQPAESGTEGQQAYADLAADGERSSAYKIPIDERPDMIPRAEEMLADARARLERIQSGEEVPHDGIHAGWERAMTDVEARERTIAALQSDELDEVDIPVVHPTHDIAELVTDQHGPDANEASGEEPWLDPQNGAYNQQEPIYIEDPPKAYAYDKRGMAAKYRDLANEKIGRMLEDSAYASDVVSRKGLGRDRTDEGMADIMAAYALPYLERARKADTRGRHKRAAAYREEATDAANYAVNSMLLEDLARVSAGVGAEVSIPTGGGFVAQKSRNRPKDMMRARGAVSSRGFSPKAILKRS